MKKSKPLIPMKKMCPTCPFRKEGYTEVQDLLVERALNEATPICHSTGKSDVVPARKKLFKGDRACRGARDLQLKIFCAFGVIEAPTDEAWRKAMDEIKKPHVNTPPIRQKRPTGQARRVKSSQT